MNGEIERIEELLTSLPLRSWEQHMVPAAALVTMVELTAGAFRAAGRQAEANRLDGVRRGFMAPRVSDVLQEERPVVPMRSRRKPTRRVGSH